MKFTVAAAAVVAGVAAQNVHNVTTITSDIIATSTEVVTAYTTYCPLATSFVENNSTYIVTEATTITVTNCPCTRTTVYTTQTTTVCPVTETPVPPKSSKAPVVPSVSSTVNITHTSVPPSVVTAGAAKAGAAGLAAVVGAVAYLL